METLIWASADTLLSAWDMEGQMVFSEQALAQASAWEADLELPDLGLEQVLEATALPQQAHQLCPEALGAHPDTILKFKFSFPHTIMAKAMVVMVLAASMDWADMAPTARVVSIIHTAVMVPSASTPAYSVVVTAWEAQVSLVLLHLALNSLWHLEAKVH